MRELPHYASLVIPDRRSFALLHRPVSGLSLPGASPLAASCDMLSRSSLARSPSENFPTKTDKKAR